MSPWTSPVWCPRICGTPGPRPRHAAIDAEDFESLDDIEKIRYRDINDVTDDDINVYGATGTKA